MVCKQRKFTFSSSTAVVNRELSLTPEKSRRFPEWFGGYLSGFRSHNAFILDQNGVLRIDCHQCSRSSSFAGGCCLQMDTESKPELPAGPIGLPFVGYLPFLMKEGYKKVWNLSKKYGDLFCRQEIVHEWHLITNASSSGNSSQGRPREDDLDWRSDEGGNAGRQFSSYQIK
ncbi:hypothetical protein CEXT_290701 [Caerostris extrusa]|uniref:Uncharacterized protein n=1 Tax=Caerostris extrusa TaxID=172846 RepID=A0AAV4PFK4_CAEEX|nr:hypothetical protein CEXT_290701 [Caerostris extrusa]